MYSTTRSILAYFEVSSTKLTVLKRKQPTVMLHNCYHSQGINNGTQLEQGGFSLKSDLPPSHKK